MKRLLFAALCVMMAGGALAQPSVGTAAPTFAAKDLAGKPVALADFKGKFVVLEWTNPDCPYVRKHYNSGNMPTTQKQAMTKGVVWLSVSTGDTHTPAELQSWQKTKSATPTATLADADGKIARAYGARTTPHMYIIDPQGTLDLRRRDRQQGHEQRERHRQRDQLCRPGARRGDGRQGRQPRHHAGLWLHREVPQRGVKAARGERWRRDPESNRAERICNPVHNRFAIAPWGRILP